MSVTATLHSRRSSFGVAQVFTHPMTGHRYAKVFPSKLYGTSESIQLVTLLGSCVSACARDPVAKIGGMNHFMLPAGTASSDNPEGDHRYGQSAMDCLISNLIANGAKRERLEIKLFGGGNMLERGDGHSIGDSNIEFAQRYCESQGFRVMASDLGKHCPRKIVFDPLEGSVQVKRLEPMYRAMVEKATQKTGVTAISLAENRSIFPPV